MMRMMMKLHFMLNWLKFERNERPSKKYNSKKKTMKPLFKEIHYYYH